MPNIGPPELLLILLIVLLLFGATRLPKLSRSMGQSIRGFKQGLKDELPADADDEDEDKPVKSIETKADAPDKDAPDKDAADKADQPAS